MLSGGDGMLHEAPDCQVRREEAAWVSGSLQSWPQGSKWARSGTDYWQVGKGFCITMCLMNVRNLPPGKLLIPKKGAADLDSAHASRMKSTGCSSVRYLCLTPV